MEEEQQQQQHGHQDYAAAIPSNSPCYADASEEFPRSPSFAELSPDRRSAFPERSMRRDYDSVGDFRRFDGDHHQRGGRGSSSNNGYGSYGERGYGAGAGGAYRSGGGGGGYYSGGIERRQHGGAGAGLDRWARFSDTRHSADRGEKRAAWLQTHDAEIQALSAQVDEEDDPYSGLVIEVTGNNPPEKYMERFTDLDLGEILDSNILRAKYVNPMPVQRTAIPIVLAGRDLMACAQTGSGKTAAFLLPIISSILMNAPPPPPPESALPMRGARSKAFPQALILAPTRELACQTYDEAQRFAFGSPVRAVVVYGGADVVQQLRELERGCDVLVATPGRLVDLIERARISLCLVKYLTLDEADRMLDMGFEPQIRRIVEREDLPPLEARQTLMFSATFPKEIQALASDFLNDYLFLTIGRTGSTVSNIIQRLVHVESENERRSAVVDLLQAHPGLTLVFVETKREADMMECFLAEQGFNVTSIHGDRTQQEREAALRSFRDHRATILVATDVAARGLDIPSVIHVINYELPSDIDNYVHRIGRTGRARKAGLATSFISEKNRAVFPQLYDMLTETNQDIPDWFASMVRSSGFGSHGSGGGYRRGGRGRGGRSYDFRREHGGGGFGGGERGGPRGGDRYGGRGGGGGYSADWGRRGGSPQGDGFSSSSGTWANY